MEPVKIHAHINAPDQILGLEIADGAILLLVFFLAFLFNRKGLFLNLLVLALVYFALRLLKRGKPGGYLLVLFRFLLLARFRRRPEPAEAEEIRSAPPDESLRRGGNTCP